MSRWIKSGFKWIFSHKLATGYQGGEIPSRDSSVNYYNNYFYVILSVLLYINNLDPYTLWIGLTKKFQKQSWTHYGKLWGEGG